MVVFFQPLPGAAALAGSTPASGATATAASPPPSSTTSQARPEARRRGQRNDRSRPDDPGRDRRGRAARRAVRAGDLAKARPGLEAAEAGRQPAVPARLGTLRSGERSGGACAPSGRATPRSSRLGEAVPTDDNTPSLIYRAAVRRRRGPRRLPEPHVQRGEWGQHDCRLVVHRAGIHGHAPARSHRRPGRVPGRAVHVQLPGQLLPSRRLPRPAPALRADGGSEAVGQRAVDDAERDQPRPGHRAASRRSPRRSPPAPTCFRRLRVCSTAPLRSARRPPALRLFPLQAAAPRPPASPPRPRWSRRPVR